MIAYGGSSRGWRRGIGMKHLLLLVLVFVAFVAIPRSAYAGGKFSDFQSSKERALRDFIAFKTGDSTLARSLANQYAAERRNLVAALQRTASVEEGVRRSGIRNSVILRPGDFEVVLPGKTVTWVLQDGCEITSETWRTEAERAFVGLAGLGLQDLIAAPTSEEKRLDASLMELPAGEELTISTTSLSPFGKAVIVVGAIVFSGGCRGGGPLTCSPTSSEDKCKGVLAGARGRCQSNEVCTISTGNICTCLPK